MSARDALSPAGYHRVRQASILRSHPEIRALLRPNAWTAVSVVGLAALQLMLAAWTSTLHWGWLAIVALACGAIIAHALGVLIHEASHNLVFRGTVPNLLIAMIANVPLVLPGAIDFREKHLLHHTRLGEGPERDFQTPTPEAIQWVGRSWWRRLVWLAVGSIVFPGRSIEGARGIRQNRWILVNVAIQVTAMAALVWAFGPKALAYLAFSAFFSFGPHVLSMRGYAEHLGLAEGQPTNSYYGLGNLVAFNVGHHVEHHDFPGAPWSALPEIRRMAAEAYRGLRHHDSWTKVAIGFLRGRGRGVADYVDAARMRRRDS
jgi:sphingolipid delta-4 desaturase